MFDCLNAFFAKSKLYIVNPFISWYRCTKYEESRRNKQGMVKRCALEA